MHPFYPSRLPLAALTQTLGLSVTQSEASIVVTLPTTTTAGSIFITADISYTIAVAGSAALIVFDNWVTPDGSFSFINGASIAPDLAYNINGGPQQSAGWNTTGFVDNVGSSFEGITPADGYLVLGQFITLATNNVLTLKAATYMLAASSLPSGFNPAAAQTFTGSSFLADLEGKRLSALTVVPEPGATVLGALAGLTLLRRRRR